MEQTDEQQLPSQELHSFFFHGPSVFSHTKHFNRFALVFKTTIEIGTFKAI